MKAYVLDIGQLHNGDFFAEGFAKVDLYRQNKIVKLRNEQAKKSSLGAGLLLQYAFGQLGKDSLLENIAYTEKGKPYLPNEELYFNLSHSGEKVFCVTSDKPIGCDIEKIRNTIPKYLGKILTKTELEYFATISDNKKIQYFFKLWTLKESIGKYYGLGLAFPFAEVAVMDKNMVLDAMKYKNDTVYLHSVQQGDYMLGICAKERKFIETIKNLEIHDVL